MSPKNSPHCSALWFVYIWMPGKEESVLVQLGSQHKCVEQPVQPMFSRLSISCDYVQTKLYLTNPYYSRIRKLKTQSDVRAKNIIKTTYASSCF